MRDYYMLFKYRFPPNDFFMSIILSAFEACIDWKNRVNASISIVLAA